MSLPHLQEDQAEGPQPFTRARYAHKHLIGSRGLMRI